MKSALVFVVGLLLSISVFAVQDGEYRCSSKDKTDQVTYKINTLTVSGLSLTVMEVTRVTTDEDGTKTYAVKGVANQFTNDKGEEILTLGNHVVELVAGRPSCAE
jgi:hypothetical protein